MPLGDEYRTKATQMYERARVEPNGFIRAEFESLSLAYLRLASQADRNGTTDVVYETPPPPPEQQQQQEKPGKSGTPACSSLETCAGTKQRASHL
jgi:hypothetical protein